MNLSELKGKVGVSKFELNTALDVDNKPTDWLRHWDNDNRVSVSLHKDLFAELKADTTGKIDTLALQTEVREGAKGEYTSHRIIKYTPAQFEL